MSTSDTKQPSELSLLRAEYKSITSKNPSPSLNADKLRAKIAELKAEPVVAPPVDPVVEPVEPVVEPVFEPPVEPAAEPVAEPAAAPVVEQPGKPVADPAAQPAAEPVVDVAPDSTEAELVELGLVVDDDGLVTLELLVGISGVDFALGPKDRYRCGPAEAIRFVRRDMAIAGPTAA